MAFRTTIYRRWCFAVKQSTVRAFAVWEPLTKPSQTPALKASGTVSCKVHTWIEICASLNHRKNTKADGSRLIPRKHTEALVLLSEVFFVEIVKLWSQGKNAKLKFGVPMFGRQPKKHLNDWYFCLVNTKRFPNQTSSTCYILTLLSLMTSSMQWWNTCTCSCRGLRRWYKIHTSSTSFVVCDIM